MSDPFDVVRQFEQALCEYTGAPYCVTTTSCTMALLLACSYKLSNRKPSWNQMMQRPRVFIPAHTYIGVPMSIIHAGGWPVFVQDRFWHSAYELSPLRVWDSARYLHRDMWRQPTYNPGQPTYDPGSMVCLSFHWNKTLGIGQGGAILLGEPEADKWLRMARFDGRTEGVSAMVDQPSMIGYHAYMRPEDAAAGLVRLSHIGDGNDGLTRSCREEYPDLSRLEVFRA